MSTSVRIKGFDGCRALAVTAVFLGHRTFLWKTEFGHVAVLVFFALSGWLIVGGLHRDKMTIENGLRGTLDALVAFLRRRTLRIFPIYYLTLAVTAVLGAGGWTWQAAPWHALYLSNIYQAYVLGTWQDSFGHLWSLAIEEQFYLLAAPALLLLPSRWHATACAIVIAIGAAVGIAHVASGAIRIVWVTDSVANFAFLAMGGFARTALSGWRMPAADWAVGVFGLAVLGLALVPLMDRPSLSIGVAILIAGLAASGLILAIVNAQDSLLVRWLEWPPLAGLGVISYAFYLYTDFIWLPAPFPGALGHALQLALDFAAGLALSAASWWLIEKRLIAWGHRWRSPSLPAHASE